MEIKNKNNNEMIVKLSKNEVDNMLRKIIRTAKDSKLMSEQDLKMLSCYKKDGIELDYTMNDAGEIIINLKDTTFGDIRDTFKMDKILG